MTLVKDGWLRCGAPDAAQIDRPDLSGRITEIYEGTSEIQRLVIANNLLK